MTNTNIVKETEGLEEPAYFFDPCPGCGEDYIRAIRTVEPPQGKQRCKRAVYSCYDCGHEVKRRIKGTR